jgi:hypothetical protein
MVASEIVAAAGLTRPRTLDPPRSRAPNVETLTLSMLFETLTRSWIGS